MKRLLAVIALVLASGGMTATVASAESALSAGCATLHSLEPDQSFTAVTGDAVLTAADYSVGEMVRLVATGDPDGAGPFVTISRPGRPDAYLSGNFGETLLYRIPASDTYTFTLKARVPPSPVTWSPGCGLPPTPAMVFETQEIYVDQHAEATVSCAEQTNPLQSCKDSQGQLDLACATSGCVRTLDTSIPGSYLYQVTGVDSRGLTQTVQFWYSVQRRPQTIQFTSSPPENAAYGGNPYQVAAVASPSSLPVSFSTGSPQVCSVAGDQVSFVGVGTCVIRASQPGDNRVYAAAPIVTQSFQVSKWTPAIGGFTVSKGLLGLTPTTFKGTLARIWYPHAGLFGWIVGEQLTFSVAGKTVCTAITGADGVASCKATIGLANALNEKEYRISYAGSAFYNSATGVGRLK